MSLTSGSKLGAYEIVAPIGAGGMGEVFRAKDTRLNREVAIKVLPEAFAEDKDRLQRFRREAQLVASLNHPNVAAIYGLEEANGAVALALELVDGEDLQQRLARGPIPVDETLAIARQIAEGLEAAHERGVVHRDLKPANVKVTADGTVKILDFGLAKAMDADAASGDSGLSRSPTMSRHMTEAGMVLGTAAYMSPEQARGKAVDKRSDIWSFGVVLYEMLTGRRLFRGETVSDVLAAVLRQDVDLSHLPPETPTSVRRLLARCLEREAKRRLRDIGDARWELEDAREAASSAAPAAARRSPALLGAAVLAAAAASGLAAWFLKPAPAVPRQPLARASYPLGSRPGRAIPRRLLAISPDGRTIATVLGAVGTVSWLEVRGVDELKASRVVGSDGARSVFFSPDSRFLGFTTDTAIKKVSIDSRTVEAVADVGANMAAGPSGAAWGDDGLVYFGATDGIRSVPVSGGAARLAVPGTSLLFPCVLPGSRFLLLVRGQSYSAAPLQIVLRSLKDGKETVLTTGTSPLWVSGVLLFARADGVYAAPFVPEAGRLGREPILVVPQVAMMGDAGQYDVSRTGTLIELPGSMATEQPKLPRRVQANGEAPLSKSARQYSDPRISPDGQRIAFHLEDDANDIWTLDATRDVLTRLTFEPGEDETPAWSPDGRWIAWSGTRGDKRSILRRRADGSGGEEVLFTLQDHAHVTDWSPDGRSLVVDVFRTSQRTDIARLDLGEKPSLHPFLETPFDESSGRVSPDGRWLAYRSDESGRDEIYVQPFPDGGAKVQVSTGGGLQPVWSKDGRVLYFRSDPDVMAARMVTGSALAFEPPRPLFKDRFESPQGAAHTSYDVFADGSFLFLESAAPANAVSAGNAALIATFHWLENLDLSKAAR
jgi:serine/threonine-protein kinase